MLLRSVYGENLIYLQKLDGLRMVVYSKASV